jgi:hypothetical protein
MPTPPGRRPRDLVVEHPSVAGVADGVQHGTSDGDVVGLVEVAAPERLSEVGRDDDLGSMASYGGGDGGAERYAVLDDPVLEAEELHRVDPDDARRLDLLRLAHPAALVGMHPVDARLAAGHHDVDDPLALSGPPGDRGGGAELEVVGVGDDCQPGLPGLVKRLEAGLFGHGPDSGTTAPPVPHHLRETRCREGAEDDKFPAIRGEVGLSRGDCRRG